MHRYGNHKCVLECFYVQALINLNLTLLTILVIVTLLKQPKSKHKIATKSCILDLPFLLAIHLHPTQLHTVAYPGANNHTHVLEVVLAIISDHTERIASSPEKSMEFD